MVKLYFPKHLYNPKNRGQLFPLLKPFLKGEDFTEEQRLEMYHVSSSDFCLVDSIKEADCIMLPMSWNYYVKNKQLKEVKKFITEANKLQKKVLSFTTGDFGVAIPTYDNLIVFRPSGERSKLPNNHFGLPSFIVDPLQKHFNSKKVYIREYNPKPVIGFCGQTNSSTYNAIKETIRTVFRNLKFYCKLSNELPQKIQSTSKLRSKVLEEIKKSSKLEANFIERNKYRAGVKSKEERQKTTQEFYNNIKETDYTVCIRGAGNFSVRFYETLAMGRIPIFVNTDCILPLADKIDWKKHVVWIEENEIPFIEEKVLDFHNNCTPEKLKEIQYSNPKLWEEKLTLGGFFKHFTK